MLKENNEKIATLEESGAITSALAAAMRGEGSELENKAMTASGAVAEWSTSVGQVYHIVGFDIINAKVRVYKNKSKNQFERLQKEGADVFTADGTDKDGKALGDYVERPIAYPAAIVAGGDRSNISITALQSYARNRNVIKPDKLKGKTNILALSAPTPADFIAMHSDTLMDSYIELAAFDTDTKSRFETKVCVFAKTEKKA